MEPSPGKSIGVPCESEEHYAACVAAPESFRQPLTVVCGQHPALFPAGISEGFVLHDQSWSLKQQVMRRRLELKATAEVCLERPSFLLRQRSAARARLSLPWCTSDSNALDRLINPQDRRLYAMRSLHGTPDAARLAMRAMALPWNFHPYGAGRRRADPTRRSPFHDLHGFAYHPNWLHNLLIASSMGGRKL